jgi:DNA-binding response OmpR family regulator/DNA-binding CsgD family transcriptional regulator
MKKQVILVIDDAMDDLQLLGKLMESLNVDMSFANSAQKALDILESFTPDLIVLDIIMPEIDGFELCEIINKNESTKDIPIIFISAKDNIEDIEKGFTLGARDYITKPFMKEELVSRVSTQLDVRAKEIKLRELNKNLEKRVNNRTAELSEKKEKLAEYSATLRVLLENRDKDRKIIEKRIIDNVCDMVLPTINKLKMTSLDNRQMMLLDQSIKSLQDIVSPLMSNLNDALGLYGFTSTELNIIKHIIKGMRTSEISEALNLSESTVNFHRNNIRSKLNLKNKKVNLYIYLNQLVSKEFSQL